MFRMPVHSFFSWLYIKALKTRFELSRVNLYRNDLRRNKNYFELERSSTYWGFELSGVNCYSLLLQFHTPSLSSIPVFCPFNTWPNNFSCFFDCHILSISNNSFDSAVSHPFYLSHLPPFPLPPLFSWALTSLLPQPHYFKSLFSRSLFSRPLFSRLTFSRSLFSRHPAWYILY